LTLLSTLMAPITVLELLFAVICGSMADIRY
jgi:hypothetical protein